jgi:hypothetical protein
MSPGPFLRSPVGELLHHIHALHPAVYPTLPSSTSRCSLDLVKLARRHVPFMEQLLVFRDSCEDASAIESLLLVAVQDYSRFLVSLRGQADGSLKSVPSLLVDHIWHTHMSWSPRLYSEDCLRVCGHGVDHRVEEEAD